MEPPVRRVEYLLGPAIVHGRHEIGIGSRVDWDESFLNPKNRVDSLLPRTRWNFLREDLFASRFAVVPEFALGHPPLKVLVCLHEDIDLDSSIWRPLQPDLTTIVQGRGRRKSQLTQHILNCLEYWSSRLDNFEDLYLSLPFGSQILIDTLGRHVRDTSAHFVPQYDLELEWHSVKALQRMWNLPANTWPPAVDLSELQLHDELHEAISLVAFKDRHGSQKFIFKSNVKHVKYLYHELRALLTIEPHPNIIGRPMYLVTKKVNFGGKHGVCGMILEYYPTGSLSQFLQPDNPLLPLIDIKTRHRWALQAASALLHIKRSPAAYYSDLKADNVVLKQREHTFDIVLLDFEQRGSWFSWSPPEVNLVSHLTYLATRRGTRFLPAQVNQSYTEFLRSYLPAWSKKPEHFGKQISNEGSNVAWLSLLPRERERAMVFMLGKLLWCMFELQPTINAEPFLGADIFREVNPSHRFPEFRQTPSLVQQLIRRCTHGAPEWLGNKRRIVRQGSTIFPIPEIGQENSGTVEILAEQAQTATKEWWETHLERAKGYIIQRFQNQRQEITTAAEQRPTIEEAVQLLQDLSSSMA